MGNPNELDTIYGSKAEQHLGNFLKNIGPAHEGGSGRLMLSGLPTNIPFLSAVETGPDFNLHSLKVSKKYSFIFDNFPYIRMGHFRNSRNIDMLAGYGMKEAYRARIYWSDENGDFDSSRYTFLLPSQIRGQGLSFEPMTPYVARLTSDTVDDIIMGVDYLFSHLSDSIFFAHIKGGEELYIQGKECKWDELAFVEVNEGIRIYDYYRNTSQGDWRGVGREDMVASDDYGNFFYYRNDPPFSLPNLVRAMREDTLISIYDWSLYPDKFFTYHHWGGNLLSMKAFPKQSLDKSVDLLLPLPINAGDDFLNENGICVFKGGPEFGNKRLYLDSSDFFLHCPGYYDADFSRNEWPGAPINCGDLTGTGYNVIGTGGGVLSQGFIALYVTEKALDDKIDVFWPILYGGGGGADGIRTNSQVPSSLIISFPYTETEADRNRGKTEVGTIALLSGYENIPIRLNPKYSVEERSKLDSSIHHIIAYPNPCDQKTVLTFDNCTGDKMLVDVINAKGEVCQSEVTPSGYGLQEYAVFLNSQPAGTYYIRLTCPRDGWSATTNVVKTGAAQTPWKLDLRKMIGR